MPTTLTYDEQVRNAMKVYHAVAKFRDTLWADDEKQIAMMAMVEGVAACDAKYSKGTQAVYIQQYVRGRLQSFRKGMRCRHFEPELRQETDGPDGHFADRSKAELAEAPVEATQEADLEHKQQCEAISRALAKMSKVDRETVVQMLDPAKKELEKGEALGLTPQGWGNRRRNVTARLKALVEGEGIS